MMLISISVADEKPDFSSQKLSDFSSVLNHLRQGGCYITIALHNMGILPCIAMGKAFDAHVSITG